MTLDGRPVLLLCSNDYLGLAGHPRVRAAARAGVKPTTDVPDPAAAARPGAVVALEPGRARVHAA